MIIRFIQKSAFFRGMIYKIGKNRARDMIRRIKPFLNINDSILDIGSGTCNVCELLSKSGYKITPLDVQNLSFVKNLKPILFDGNKIPFNDNEFDISLLLTVLHHIPQPEKILMDAKRVSKNLIVMEDIYTNRLHKLITHFFDSLLNFEFKGHPHTNKSDGQWKKTFEKIGYKLIDVKYHSSFLFLKHATYYLRK